jgi:dipeptidyl aminopeptidase/acylaminoacyl peptidase
MRWLRHLLIFLTLSLGAGFALRAAESNALISPDGTRAVWTKEDGSGFWLAQRRAPEEVWSGRKEIGIRGVARRPVFSPDGSKLAFENSRGGYSTQGPDIWGTRAYTWGFIAVYIDRKHLLYSTNIGDADRRHIGTVALSGGPTALLTEGVASQWTPVPMAGDAVALIEGGWATAPAVMVRDASGKVTATGGPAARALPKNMVEPQPVTFSGTDGQKAYGQLFIPSKPSGCAIVFVHGGITRQMLLGFHYMDAYSVSYEMNQYFSMRGCVVLSIEYRSSIMHGYAFRNAPGWGNAGASEYKDVLGGAEYLKSRRDLQVAKIGIYGLSWGGYLTAQALARNSDVFAAGFDMAGVHAFPGDSFKYSPAAFAKQWRSPVYIAAGDDDRDLDFNQSIVLVQALHNQSQQVEIGIKVIPNEIHDFRLTFEDLLDVYWQGSEFMLDHLLPR